MKALTLNGDWFQFEMKDAPTRYLPEEFALMGRPGTPRLLMDKIIRGVPDYGVFEGDIIEAEGCKWLVCYERGFYAISASYVTRHLHTFSDFKVVSNCFTEEFPVPVSLLRKHLFKSCGVVFRMEDILGCDDTGNLIIRCISDAVPCDKIQQCCGMSLNGGKAFFGDVTPNGVVVLHKGRVAYASGGVFVDTVTGGII